MYLVLWHEDYDYYCLWAKDYDSAVEHTKKILETNDIDKYRVPDLKDVYECDDLSLYIVFSKEGEWQMI